MANPEQSLLEIPFQRTAEAAHIVKEGLQPGFEAFWDRAVLLILTHPFLRRIFGRAYYHAYERENKRREKHSLAVIR